MALTKVQLEALKNALLASQQPINAATHRDFIQNVIDEMYDAQSRGNLLAGVQSNSTTTTGDTLLLIRSGEMFLVPTSLFGGVGKLTGLSDVVIIDEEGDEVLMYNAVDNVWKNVSLNGRFITPAQLNAALEGFQLPQGARLISADLILTSGTAGTITSEWVDFTGQTESVTNAALAFNAAGLPSAGNFRFDIVQGANNGTVSVKRGIEGSASGVAAPSSDANNLILALILWAEDGTGEVGQPGNGNVLQNDFSVIRFGTQVTANSTGLFAKVLETDLSASGSYSIILAYAEPRNAVNFDGSGAQELRVSFTVDTARVIIAQTVQVVTSQGSSAGEFVLYQLAGNRAAVYHRSNHFWGRIQFRVVFQSSQVPLTDFVNNAPYAGEIGFLARYGSVVDGSESVSYNVADVKNSTQRQQARENIGLFGATPTISSAGFARNYIRPTNFLIGRRGQNNDFLFSMQAGGAGEQVLFYSDNTSGTFGYDLVNEDLLSVAENRLFIPQGTFKLIKGQIVVFTYDPVILRWRMITAFTNSDNYFLGLNTFEAAGLANPAVRIISKFANDAHELFGVYFNTTEKGISAKRQAIEFGKNVLFEQSILSPTGATPGLRLFTWNSALDVPFTFQKNGLTYATFGVFGFVLGNSIIINNGIAGVETIRLTHSTGRIFHSRSSIATESIRRDEQRLFYLSTISTTGAINNQALTSGIFNYRFTLATSITGFTLGEIGLSIIIQNQTGAALTLVNESALSDAANRLRIIGGSNLVIPIDGKATLIYVTGNRWELLETNFNGLSTNGFKAKGVRTQTGFFDPNISGTTPIGIFQTPFSWLASYFSVGTVIEIDLVGTFSQDFSNFFINLKIGTDNYSDIEILANTGVDDLFRVNYKITISSSNEIKIATTVNTPGGLSLIYFETATKNLNTDFDIDIKARFDNSNAANNVKSNLIEVKVY